MRERQEWTELAYSCYSVQSVACQLGAETCFHAGVLGENMQVSDQRGFLKDNGTLLTCLKLSWRLAEEIQSNYNNRKRFKSVINNSQYTFSLWPKTLYNWVFPLIHCFRSIIPPPNKSCYMFLKTHTCALSKHLKPVDSINTNKTILWNQLFCYVVGFVTFMLPRGCIPVISIVPKCLFPEVEISHKGINWPGPSRGRVRADLTDLPLNLFKQPRGWTLLMLNHIQA